MLVQKVKDRCLLVCSTAGFLQAVHRMHSVTEIEACCVCGCLSGPWLRNICWRSRVWCPERRTRGTTFKRLFCASESRLLWRLVRDWDVSHRICPPIALTAVSAALTAVLSARISSPRLLQNLKNRGDVSQQPDCAPVFKIL